LIEIIHVMKSINAIISSTGRELGRKALLDELHQHRLHKAVKLCMLNTLREAFMELEASELDELVSPNMRNLSNEQIFDISRNRVYTDIKLLIDDMEEQIDKEVNDDKDKYYYG
jgi:hypothetical protein